jgi:hypothetical protein
MLAWDLALRLWSWLWAHWKGVLVVLVAGGVLWGLWASLDAYGDRRAAEAVLPWQEAARKAAAAAGAAQAEADARHAKQYAATVDAARRFADAQTENARLAGINRALDVRLRHALAEARAGGDPLPAAAPDPAEPEPEGVGLDARAVALALSGYARGCAESRDALRDQVNALIDAWPR